MDDRQILIAVGASTLIILVAICAALAALFVAHRNRVRQQAALAATRIAYEQELRTIAAEVSEQTMTSIGRELHDNICNRLAVLNAHLEVMAFKNPETASALKPATEALSIAYSQARLLSHSLNADVVAGSRLSAMLETEIGRLQALGQSAVHWSADGDEPELSPDARLVAFRIFQEAVSNALKHAAGAAIYVDLRGAPAFRLTVRDEGPGFSIDATMGSGAGLRTMQRRAALAGMQCSVQSSPGAGTVIVLESAAS